MRFLSVVIFVILFIVGVLYSLTTQQNNTIKIGLLYSKTGTMSNEEKILEQVLTYQVQKINQEGGLLNSKIEIIKYDGKSDEKEFYKGAKYLIEKGVKTIFGSWTSASRKAIKPLIEKEDALLFYPVQYEGIEESNNIIYLGSLPNQQIKPTIAYIKNNFGKKIYIVGSDYIYPRINHIYLTELSKLVGMDILGSCYLPLGETDFTTVVDEIKTLKPDVIINTLNGESNIAFFKELYENEIDSNKIPVFSTSIDENSIKKIDSKALKGHYITGSYFNSIDSIANTELKKEYRNSYGKEFVLTDAGFNLHVAFEFYKKAVLNKKMTQEKVLLNEMKNDSIKTAAGILYIGNNNHIYKSLRIAKIKENSTEIVWSSKNLSEPKPFSTFKKKNFWINEEKKLYKEWNQSWQAKADKGGYNE